MFFIFVFGFIILSFFLFASCGVCFVYFGGFVFRFLFYLFFYSIFIYFIHLFYFILFIYFFFFFFFFCAFKLKINQYFALNLAWSSYSHVKIFLNTDRFSVEMSFLNIALVSVVAVVKM